MDEIKSLDYLQEIVKKIGRKETVDVLELVGYILADNDYSEARYFLDDLIDVIDK